jgi:hypothetical protein
MNNTPPLVRSRLDPLLVLWGVCAAWAAVTNGFRILLQIYAEVGLGIDTHIHNRDFVNYWVGSQLALSGDSATVFVHPLFYAHLQSLFGADFPLHSWSYPPHYLMLVSPLALLPYGPSMAVFLLLSFALFVWSALAFVREFAPEVRRSHVLLGVTAFALVMAETTQNGFLTAAAVLCALANMRRRPMLAGFALALLTMKPQLGILIPLLALLDRNWALLRWATIFTALLVGASVLVFGTDAWQAFFTHVIPYQDFVMKHWIGPFLELMPGTYGSLRSLGVSVSTALVAQSIVSVFALAALWPLLRALRDPLERAFALLAVTFVATPYAFHYDMGALSVTAACLALRARSAGERGPMLACGLIAVLPGIVPLLGDRHVPVAPLILIAGLAALYVTVRRRPVSVPS